MAGCKACENPLNVKAESPRGFLDTFLYDQATARDEQGHSILIPASDVLKGQIRPSRPSTLYSLDKRIRLGYT